MMRKIARTGNKICGKQKKLREMRSNGEEGGRPVLFLFVSFPLQNQSLEVEFRFRLETGNTSKSPSVFTFVFVYLSAVSELYNFILYFFRLLWFSLRLLIKLVS